MISGQRDSFEQLQSLFRSLGHRDRGSPVQLDDRRGVQPCQYAIELGDLRPISLADGRSVGVKGGDRGLHAVAAGWTGLECTLSERRALDDLRPVPTRA